MNDPPFKNALRNFTISVPLPHTDSPALGPRTFSIPSTCSAGVIMSIIENRQCRLKRSWRKGCLVAHRDETEAQLTLRASITPD